MARIKLSTLIVASVGVAVTTSASLGYWYTTSMAPTVVENLKTIITAGPTPQVAPKFLTSIRGRTPITEMKEPLSVAVAGNGRIFVADTGNGRIQAYDPNGEFLYQFGWSQENPLLEMPVTVAWRNGEVFVGDTLKNAILIFNESGRLLRTISAKELGIDLRPLAFAFDGDTLYVASAPGHVFVFGPDGRLINTIARPGGPEGYLGYPNGVAILDGKIVVADSNNQRIQVFDKAGKVQTVKTDLNLGLPRGLVADRFGRLMVVDTFAHQVVALDKDLKVLFRFGQRGLEEKQFNFPNQAATDSAGRLYIADRENNRIAVYGY